jgi:hypothetical protein
MFGKIVRASEFTTGKTAHSLETGQMRGLCGARHVCGRVVRATLGALLRGFRDEQAFAVIERQPRLPLRVGNGDAIFQCLAEWRQRSGQIGIFGEQRVQLSRARIGTGHAAHEMNHGVAIGDIDVELVERVAAEVLEILLHLHFDIVPREISAELIAIDAKLVGNGREKNLHGQGCAHNKLNEAIISYLSPSKFPKPPA